MGPITCEVSLAGNDPLDGQACLGPGGTAVPGRRKIEYDYEKENENVQAPSKLYLPGPTKRKTIMMQNISIAREYWLKLCGYSRNVEAKATTIVKAINAAAG
ncbi:MAG TPA: hypothetical protein VE860_01080, partial [Chthoniobacterales bacterium]|nr:hypothetical protein [Chthoniobacterales bacterium]